MLGGRRSQIPVVDALDKLETCGPMAEVMALLKCKAIGQDQKVCSRGDVEEEEIWGSPQL